MRRYKWITAFMALIFLMGSTTVIQPSEAANLAQLTETSGSSTATVNAKLKELRFKLGSDMAYMNGIKKKVEKPFAKNGSTMIPVSLLVNGLGLQGKWVIPNKSYTIKAGNRFMEVTVGKQEAIINRKVTSLGSMPVMKNGTLMVPLRELSDGLGASITVGADKTVIVKWDPKQASSDMSRVGSSSMGWSIYLPQGWTYAEKNNGTLVEFNSNNGLDHITLEIEETEAVWAAEDLLDAIYERGRIFEKIKEAVIGEIDGFPYASVRLEARNAGELMFQSNRYQTANQHHIYDLNAFITDTNKAEHMYNGVLLSFRPMYSLAARHNTERDLYAQTERKLAYPELGVSATIPTTWRMDRLGNYKNSDSSILFNMVVQDRKRNVGVKEIADKQMGYFEKSLIPGSYQILESTPFTLKSGQTGLLKRIVIKEPTYSYTLNILYAVDLNYAYSITCVDKSTSRDGQKQVGNVLSSVKVDASQVSGEMGQLGYMLDWEQVEEESLVDLSASIRKPASWFPIDMAPTVHLYQLPVQGIFKVAMSDINNLKDARSNVEMKLKQTSIVTSYKNERDEIKTINGHKARTLTYRTQIDKQSELVRHMIFIQYGTDVYELELNVSPSGYTEAIQKQFMQVAESLNVIRSSNHK